MPSKRKKGQEKRKEHKGDSAKDESQEARVILNPKPILKFAFCTCLKL